ncbi:MAG: hypothetical protein LC751_18550 [Actinobacteria bacterium]|nr:hypothetical protein [Actinomycetota bacterium]MCA1740073.1 hypothetical protein [Actinomycetota bacterium]
MAKNTSDIIVERLLEWGIDTYFGLPGDGINGFFESLRQARMAGSSQVRERSGSPSTKE